MADALDILLIEDTEADYLLIERRLRQDGLHTRCRQVSSRGALDEALETGDWDIVLADYNVPGLVFSEILTNLRQRYPDLPVILVSGSLGEETAVDMLKQGIWDFVLKDRLARLGPAIERALNDARAQREKRAAEAQLHRLYRLYAVLGSINETIARYHDKTGLFSECCRIAVEQGGFMLAWIGMVDPESGLVQVITHSGEAGDYLDHLNINVAADNLGCGPTGSAARLGSANVCNNIAQDSRMLPWRENALRMGYRSSAAIPVRENGELRYTLSLYTDRPGFFDEEEVRLLDRLSTNLSYALDGLNSEAQRLEAEHSQARQHTLLKAILESIPSRVFWKDRNLRYMGANRAFASDAGLSTTQQLIGKSDYELSWHEQAELYQADDIAVIESGHPRLGYEEPQVTPDGNQVWLRTSKVPLRDELNEIIGVLGIYDDITAAKQARQALTESEMRFKAIIEASPVPCTLNDDQQRITFLNASFTDTFGYTLEDIPDLSTWWQRACPDPEYRQWVEDNWRAKLDDARQEGALFEPMEVQIQCKNGSVRTVIAAASSLPGALDNLHVVTLFDITERKAAEVSRQRDHEQQATLQALLETTLTGETLEQTLTDCLQQLLAVSWLSLLPKGGVFLLDEDGKQLRLAVSHNLSSEIQSLCDRVPLGHCHCGRAASTCEMQYAQCVDELHNISYPGMADHGHYSLPLVSNGRPLGVLVLYLPPEFRRDAMKEQFLSSVADILAGYLSRKQHEERLRLSAAVLESTHEGVMVTDLEDRIVTVNPAFTRITGYAEDEILGESASILHSSHHNAAYYQQIRQTLKQAGFWQGESWNRRKSGEIYPEWLTISAIQNEHGVVTNYVAVFSDISQIKNAEEQLSHLAHHDALTDLPNRLLMQTLLKHALHRAQREGQVLAVLFMDLDRFKHVNDSLGHIAGDELLKVAADRLSQRLRGCDTIARLGGDEFILLLEELRDVDDAANVAQNIIDLFKEPIRLSSGHEVYVGASVGISLYPNDGNTADGLIRNADTAMYQAKEGGRNTYRFYTESLTQHAAQRLRLEGRLRHALEAEQMLLHYQPLVTDGHCKGLEALVRWQDPEEGRIPPMQFIPLAEETGLIIPLGEWVLRKACAQMKRWLDAGLALETLAVNVSPVQFQRPEFAQQVNAILLETGLPAAYLELEITEGAIMGQEQYAEARLAALHALGVRLAIDDFGTGYSSLAYLKRFPIHKLKIDQSFVRDIPDNLASMEIVATIIAMARNLRLEALAEGVETRSQLEYLQIHGCNTIQGYLFSPPVPAEEIPELMKKVFE